MAAPSKHPGAADLAAEEKLAQQALNRGMSHRLLPLLRPVRGLVLAVIGLETALVLAIFLRPALIGALLDHGFVRDGAGWHARPGPLAGIAAALLGVWVARFALGSWSRYLGGKAALAVLQKLRLRVFEHIQSLSVAYFDRSKAGRIIARAESDVDALEPLLIQGPPALLSTLLRFLAAGALLWLLAPRLLLTLLAVIPFLALGTAEFRRLTQRNSARVAERRGRFTAHLVESVAGVRLLQQTGQEEPNYRRYHALVSDFSQTLIRGNLASGWFAPYSAWLTTVALALMLGVGAQTMAAGTLTLGGLVQSLFYVSLFLGPLQELGDLFERYANGRASAQRIFLLLDTPPAVRDDPAAIELTAVRGDVAFQRVRFRYDRDHPRLVIQDLDLTVAAGETLAIVGPTGHGKSTLVQLLTRFYDVEEGAVTIDGRDVRHVTQASLRTQVGVVLQDNVLFGGTILDNLRLARPAATDAELLAATRALGADEILENLPHGLHTQVGPLGAQLSHGQRQLVCLVRAYVANPAILVLDEATSAVDAHTEKRLQLALRRLCEGRTAIVIAHRLATIRDADRIAVVQHGRVVEQGRHEALLVAGGLYASLYRAYEANSRGTASDSAQDETRDQGRPLHTRPTAWAR